MSEHDPENPAYYTKMDPQPLDVIEAWNLPFWKGSVLKYLVREKDSELNDLMKARKLISRRIAQLEGSPQ